MAGAMMVERAGSIPAMEPTMNYKEFVAKLEEEQNREMDEEQLREMEASALDIGQKMREEGKAKELGNLIKQIRPFTKLLSKAKAAKLIRGLVDMYLDMGADTGYEVTLCKECITWATEEKRIFLRQALEARLIGLYYDTGNYQAALSDGAKLLKELKKLDDKNLLVEVQLLESKTYHALSNLPRPPQTRLTHRHGPVHTHPPHPGRGGLPRLHVAQVCPPRVTGECRGLAEVLGRPWSLLPRGAPPGPRHQPTQLLLPYLPGSEVPVPGVVHAPSLMEWVRSPVQPSPFPTFQNPPQRD